MAKSLTSRQIWERAVAGAGWLVHHQNLDGSWRGLQSQSVDAFYKSCWALSEAGQPFAAHRALSYIHRNFTTPTGDFLRSQPNSAGSLLGIYPYVNSYIIVGSMRTGHYEIALPAISFLLTQQSADHGGFYLHLTRSGMKSMADTLSSSTAGIACLAAGKLAEARRVADYLANMVRLQPSPDDRFFTATDANGSLHTDVKDDAEAYLRIIDTKRTDQCWFAVGLPLAFLVLMEGATNERRYRELAHWYFAFQQRCLNPWDGYSSAKAGWGCAMLYRITGQSRYRDIALHIAQNIMDIQNTDGSWLSGRSKRLELTEHDFDFTGEFTLWLSLISANLFARDTSRIPLITERIKIPKPKRTQSRTETLFRTYRAHYRILKDNGLREYISRSYDYRKEQISRWIKKKP